MLKKTARQITGGLSHTSKMPCMSWSTPPSACRLGSLYSTYKNSVCSTCYAKKGFSLFPVVGRARERRLAAWKSQSRWIEAMVTLIQGHEYFRWFDAGDIYSGKQFLDICEVCKQTPGTQHWLPTLERIWVLKHQKKIPPNLTVRFSSPILNKMSTSARFPISMVKTELDHRQTNSYCHATLGSGACETCRECWNKNKPLIIYLKH